MEITVSKFNEVYLRIKAEPAISKELSEFFTYEVPNAKFIWDYYLMSKDFAKSRDTK